MKTIRMMGTALLATVFSFGISSCNSDEVDDTINPIAVYESCMDALAAPVNGISPVNIILTAGPFTNIKLGEGSTFVAYGRETRADSKNSFSGTYTINGTNIEFKAGSYNVSIPISTVIKAISISGLEYDTTSDAIPGVSEPKTQSLCRAWYPTDYHAVVMVDGKVMYNKHESSLVDLEYDLYAYVLCVEKKDVKESDLLITHEVKNFVFMSDNTFAATYTNNATDINKWKWSNTSNGEIKFIVGGNELVGEARFKQGNPNNMYIIADIDMSGAGDLGTHKVSGKLVISLSDK